MDKEQLRLAAAANGNDKGKKPKKSPCKYNKWQVASALYKASRVNDYAEASYWATYLTERLGQSEYYLTTILTKLVSEDGAPEHWKTLFPAIQALMSCAGKFHLKNSILQAIWQLCHSRKWYMTEQGREKAAIDEAIEQEVKLDARQLPGYAIDGIHCKGKDIDQSITGTWEGWHSILKLWQEHLEKCKGLSEKEVLRLWAQSHKKTKEGRGNEKETQERRLEEDGNEK
ncbi:hypothetical protein HYV85_02820 [Candidatus Woesearchaeota archaeon]|nr:hypothetical protein [Candidatus Woesearchaeota archaeon]